MNYAPAILDRIAYRGSLEPDFATLQALQTHFLLAVPFENLDIGMGVPISLELDAVVDKIVTRRRGGFCFECNSLFHHLLEAIGYRVRYGSARMIVDGQLRHPFGHMVLLVELDDPADPVLVDVGNGQSCRDPLRLSDRTPHTAEDIEYRLVEPEPGDDEWSLDFRKSGEPFSPRFYFTTTPRELADFQGMCRYHQTSPDSVFTQGRLVTLALPRGRTTLARNTLTRTHAGEVQASELIESEIPAILLSEFGIDLPAMEDQWASG